MSLVLYRQEREAGIEPASSAWKAEVIAIIPLTRMGEGIFYLGIPTLIFEPTGRLPFMTSFLTHIKLPVAPRGFDPRSPA